MDIQNFTEKEKKYLALVDELFKGGLSAKQLLLVKKWCDDGVSLVDVVSAYEKSVFAVGCRGNYGIFVYMSKIIESWQNHTEKQSILERDVQIDKLTNESN